MYLSTDSSIDDITADDQIELSDTDVDRHSGFEGIDQSRGTADQHQLKLLRERMAKMELENKLLQAELREQKLLAERNALQAKVDKIEQEQQQQQKEDSAFDDQFKGKATKIPILQQKSLFYNKNPYKMELENKLLQAKMREQKLLAERNALQAKVDKQEQEQQQKDNNKGESVSLDQFNAILARIGELEKEQNEQREGKVKEHIEKCESDQRKAILERIGELEAGRQQQMVTFGQQMDALKKQIGESVDADLLNTLLEKITELETQQKQMKLDQISRQQQNDQQKTADLAQLKTSYGAHFVNIDERLSILLPNWWDATECHDDLEITGPKWSVVHHKGNAKDWRSVFAKHPIPDSDYGIFYFEMKVETARGVVIIGLATKALRLVSNVGCRSDSYAYSCDGEFWANGSKEEGKPRYSAGDVVGCGVNLVTRQLIFTKNGQRLDTSDLPAVSSTRPLFPCISSPTTGDKIEANFGPDFKFSLAQVKELTELPQNWWDATACDSDLEIIGPKCLIVKGKDAGGSVFAKHPIRRTNAHIFYFEMKVENERRLVAIGLATKAMPLTRLVGTHSDSYAYHSDGEFWINGSQEKGKPTFSDGDVVGCGVNFAIRQLFFTKNGQRLDHADLCVPVSSIDSLFPCVSLGNSGDRIEANFGPHFKFDVGTLH